MRIDPLGIGLIATACWLRALDNNLTATLTTRDPVALVTTKATAAALTHDEHHNHRHPESLSTAEPHGHSHNHDQLEHAHSHVSDLHHRHPH
jgi:hypothetical protein